VIDEQLRPTLEQVRQRGRPVLRIETIVLVDAHPRQGLAALRQLIAAAGELLFGFEQVQPRLEPVFASSCDMHGHVCDPLRVDRE